MGKNKRSMSSGLRQTRFALNKNLGPLHISWEDLEVRRDLENWASPVNLACDRKYVCCSQASLGQEMKRTVNLKKRKFSLNDRFEGWFGPSVIFVHGFCS